MTPRIAELRRLLLAGEHHVLRRSADWSELTADFARRELPPAERAAAALEEMLAAETPVFLPGERIAYLRTVRELPELYTADEWAAWRERFSFAEKGVVFNLCPDYAATIAVGLDARLAQLDARLAAATRDGDRDGVIFLAAARRSLLAVLGLADRYRSAAEAAGRTELAGLLARVPHRGAETFHEALQLLRILHYTLWCEGEYHNGLGRLDQYLWPYLERDLAAGRLDETEALELLEEFFLSCNRDSDLYLGVQQGDNGQSLVAGGCDAAGRDAVNLLTRMILRASCELAVIDPKINLRITAETPLELLELGSELTRAGLGFPQYANDAVVIPALERWGYRTEDARNYVVAACWEFTIPGRGMDVDNIDAVSFPAAVDAAMRRSTAPDFAGFLDTVRNELFDRADAIEAKYRNFTVLPGPFISLLSDGCVERARDVSAGNRYNNFGIHGTGLSCAADALAAIRDVVYDRKALTLPEFVAVLENNFEGAPELLAAVRHAPKMGCDDDRADLLAVRLLDDFAASWAGRRNIRGGIFRPGTGSAMYYIRHADALAASADGRLRGTPFAANYAPSLNVQVPGPAAVVRSFTKPDLTRVCNGGPLTIELHDSVFRSPESLNQLAHLLRYFCRLGGHQLQLNAINRDRLLAAQADPAAHRQLIVRVWGWSGYFVELDKVYQDQIIRRAEMTFE